MPGGEGFIYTFQETDPDHCELLAKISTALSARTAGYFGKSRKGFDRFYLAVPVRADRGAEIWIYTVQDWTARGLACGYGWIDVSARLPARNRLLVMVF